VISLVDISIVFEQPHYVLRWLPTVTTSTKMDPSQPEFLLKLSISIEQDSLRYDTCVLIEFGGCLPSSTDIGEGGYPGEI